MSNPWVTELWRIVALAISALVIGIILDAVTLSLLILTVLYLGWHLYHLFHLERWFRLKESNDLLNATGIWGEIYNHVYRLQQRNRQRKMKLSKMLSRFQKSTSAMPDATVVLDEQGKIEWINKAAKRYLGLSKKKDIGQRIDNLIRNEAFSDLLARGDFDRVVEIESPENQNLFLSVRIVPYAGNQLLLIARDITRIRKLERVRQDFVANVSHELRTPLTVISGYLENMLDTDAMTPESTRNVLQQMSQQSLRMCRIVDDLLMLSRLESDRSELQDKVSVPAIIASILEEYKPLMRDKQQTIDSDIDQQLWILGNEKELYSAFSNLIMNAIKYTPEHGKININWHKHNSGASFSVQDTGIGIAAQHIPRLTERFYRVDKGRSREHGGTGLGLAIVKHVLNRHDATLAVTSKPGQGSNFTILFPKSNVIVISKQPPVTSQPNDSNEIAV